VKERNAAKREIRRAVREYEISIAREMKNNPKKFFKCANSKMKTRSGVAELQCENGSVTKTDEQKAELLNQFFSSVYTVEDLVNIQTKAQADVQEVLSDIDFSSADIMKILSTGNLKAEKSPGPDNIHPSVLKECADVLASPLHLLFQKSLNEGFLPQVKVSGR